ncbi:hypothetical protein CCAE64S_02439 [Castellaniella caeni]
MNFLAMLEGKEEPRPFTVTGMAAALHMTEEAFCERVQAGEIAPPTRSPHGVPLWTREALGMEVAKRIPERDRGLDSQALALLYVVPAMQRAEAAEMGDI